MSEPVPVSTDHVTVGRLAEHAAERNDRSDACKVEEDDRR